MKNVNYLPLTVFSNSPLSLLSEFSSPAKNRLILYYLQVHKVQRGPSLHLALVGAAEARKPCFRVMEWSLSEEMDNRSGRTAGVKSSVTSQH